MDRLLEILRPQEHAAGKVATAVKDNRPTARKRVKQT
jgi:hypothetical protein